MKDLMMKLNKKKYLFSDFIVKKNTKNFIEGLIRIVLTIQGSSMINHKAHLSIQRHMKENILQIIFLNPFLPLAK